MRAPRKPTASTAHTHTLCHGARQENAATFFCGETSRTISVEQSRPLAPIKTWCRLAQDMVSTCSLANGVNKGIYCPPPRTVSWVLVVKAFTTRTLANGASKDIVSHDINPCSYDVEPYPYNVKRTLCHGARKRISRHSCRDNLVSSTSRRGVNLSTCAAP